jgi:hypothetical protein
MPITQLSPAAEIMAALRADTPLNRARAIFSSYAAKLEQAAMQRRPIDPIEARGLEFEATTKIADALGVPSLLAALARLVDIATLTAIALNVDGMDAAIAEARAAIAAATSTEDAP